jgi:hypothetical protein
MKSAPAKALEHCNSITLMLGNVLNTQMLQPIYQGVLNILKSYYIRNVYTGAA